MRNSRRSTEESGRAPARPPELVADRLRRIDAWIDYFGSGDAHPTPVSYDMCGETLLD
jgi:hypothetical protein